MWKKFTGLTSIHRFSCLLSLLSTFWKLQPTTGGRGGGLIRFNFCFDTQTFGQDIVISGNLNGEKHVSINGRSVSNVWRQYCLRSVNSRLTINTFGSLNQGQTCLRRLNHDIAVGLCSKLLKRLAYYIHWGYVRYIFGSHGNGSRSPSECKLLTLTLDQGANSIHSVYVLL